LTGVKTHLPVCLSRYREQALDVRSA
jgi:hypothetical protein